ncbi:aminopeptidase [bacterium]|nr:aminopeptidase [bacterium]
MELTFAIHSILNDCLKLKKNEKCLVLCDEPMKDLALRFHEQCKSLCDHAQCLMLPEIRQPNAEPPKTVGCHLAAQDAAILMTSRSLSHTRMRQKASRQHCRIISLPGVTREILIRNMTGKYASLINQSRKLADILTIGKSGQLTTKAGTHLSFSMVRMKGHADTGMVHEPGQFSNIPAGEACVSPAQGASEGVVMLDGSFSGIGKIKTPVEMRVKDGFVVRIAGGEEAEKIRDLLKNYGKKGRNLAEIGIGTNPCAKLNGITLEDEKVLGTVHIGLGNNTSFGGSVSVPCHFDGILLNPTLSIDDNIILENGKLLF